MPSQLSLSSTVRLSSGTEIPQLGFGVYQSPPDITTKTVSEALKAGYRHIDSAQWYFNEAEVGKAAQSSGLNRSEIFLTTKLGHADRITERLHESVDLIDPSKDGGYVDLMLIHSAQAGPEKRKEQWKALEQLVNDGKAKSKTFPVIVYG